MLWEANDLGPAYIPRAEIGSEAPVQWNKNAQELGAECKDHPAVRGTTYLEVAYICSTSGCSPDEAMWDWARMGVIATRYGRQVVCPNDWVITDAFGVRAVKSLEPVMVGAQ